MKTPFAAALAGVFLVGAAAQAAPQYFRSDLTKQAGLPFSDAVQVGDMLYLSGQIGAPLGTRKVVDGGTEAEARQVMSNIGEILKARGLGYDDIVKCTVMMGDMSKWADFNKVYVTYFKPDRLPARSAFGANGLALGASLEVECWAAVRK